jgi:hypothetical protein
MRVPSKLPLSNAADIVNERDETYVSEPVKTIVRQVESTRRASNATSTWCGRRWGRIASTHDGALADLGDASGGTPGR